MKEPLNKRFSDLHTVVYDGESLFITIFDGDEVVFGRDAMPEWEKHIRGLFKEFHPDVNADKEIAFLKKLAGNFDKFSVRPVSDKEAKYLEKKIGKKQLEEWDNE